MDRFVKLTKSVSATKSDPAKTQNHVNESREDLLKEKARPVGNTFISSCTGHRVSQGEERAISYIHTRNLKLASQFRRPMALSTDAADTTHQRPREPEIFRNCCIYINGYMGQSISDLELRKRLVRHGARVVTNFGRRNVTHVILGPNRLAGGKIQKEMLVKKAGVKYVTVEWALDSLREGKRMVEARYRTIQHEKQKSMYEVLESEGGASAHSDDRPSC